MNKLNKKKQKNKANWQTKLKRVRRKRTIHAIILFLKQCCNTWNMEQEENNMQAFEKVWKNAETNNTKH